jgi:tetratricopeptide (TPR) repeat protein
MARSDRRRTSRTRSTAVTQHGGSAALTDDQLFFSRLRRQAKWVFVLLAVVFAGSFVVFGVGSEVPGGIADVFQGRSATDGPSVKDAQAKLERNANDTAALRELSTALQASGRPDEAIPHLQRYVELRPADEAALRELAGLHLGKAIRLREQAQRIQLELNAVIPASQFSPAGEGPLAQALQSGGPIEDTVQGRTQERLMTVYGEMQGSFEEAKEAYQRVAAAVPEDAQVQLQLADAAANANDIGAAIAAYERFVALAPDDPTTPLVKEEISRLERAQAGDDG